MKVAIAIEKYDPRAGGAERFCWDFAHFLTNQGHEAEVICMKAGDPPDPAVRVRQVRALRFPQALRHLSFGLLHFLEARKMKGHVHLALGNAFFMDVYQPRGGIHRAWLEGENRRYHPRLRKLLLFVRRWTPKNAVQEAFEWWLFRVTRPEVIAISEMIRSDIRRFYRYPEQRIHLIPNTVDTARFNPANRSFRPEIRERYGLGGDEFVFAFIANNPRLKGFDILIQACAALREQRFKVLAIGSDAAWARTKAREMGLDGMIVFGDHAPDIEKVLPACDCLVHPAYYDACSRVVIEALSSGIPAITTESNGASMYVGPSSGRVIPPDDAVALAEAMREVLEAGPGGMKPAKIAGEGHDAAYGKILEVLENVKPARLDRAE